MPLVAVLLFPYNDCVTQTFISCAVDEDRQRTHVNILLAHAAAAAHHRWG
jgi:hypothetical protein